MIERTIYLLHFAKPVCPTRPAQHYIGSTPSLQSRLDAHRIGVSNVRIMRAVYDRGIDFELARTWTWEVALERRLKSRREAPTFCPICSGADALKLANYEVPQGIVQRYRTGRLRIAGTLQRLFDDFYGWRGAFTLSEAAWIINQSLSNAERVDEVQLGRALGTKLLAGSAIPTRWGWYRFQRSK